MKLLTILRFHYIRTIHVNNWPNLTSVMLSKTVCFVSAVILMVFFRWWHIHHKILLPYISSLEFLLQVVPSNVQLSFPPLWSGIHHSGQSGCVQSFLFVVKSVGFGLILIKHTAKTFLAATFPVLMYLGSVPLDSETVWLFYILTFENHMLSL